MGGGWRVVGGGGEEVSSCTINCEYVMMCMCVRVSASVSACLRLRLRTHAHLPCPCVYFMHFSPPLVHICSYSANLNPPTIILPISLSSLCATDTPFSK